MKNQCEIRGNVAVVFVKRKDCSVHEVLIDVNDLQKIKEAKRTVYVHEIRGNFYARITLNGKKVALHRFITDCPDGFEVDHFNHHTLDNRRANLRICTHKQNKENELHARSNNSTGVLGVSKHTQANVYIARVAINGRSKHFGSFKSIEEAQKAVMAARAKYMPFSQEASA